MAESHPISPPSFHDGEGSYFPVLVPPNDPFDSKSVVGMKPGNSRVLFGYQVDEFTCTWLAECFVAQ